jgi:O-antigen/teichoic acid export membrane protein
MTETTTPHTLVPSSSVSIPVGPRPETRAPSGRSPAVARILHNVFALATGQLFTWICTIGLTALLPRYLGDANLGKLWISMSLTDLLGQLATYGITSYLTREVARRGIESRGDVLNALVMRLPLAGAACALTILATHLLRYDALTRELTYLLCINLVLSAISGVLIGALQGLQQMRTVALVNVLSKATMLGIVAFFLVNDYGLIAVALAWNIASFVAVIGCIIPAIRLGLLGGRIDPRLWRVLMVGCTPFFVWQAALVIYGQIDVILLSVLTSDAVVGWYTAAYRIVSIPIFVPTIISAAIFPALARSATHAPTEFRMIARRSLHYVILGTIPLALGTIVVSARLLEFLHYPEVFRNSIPVIIVLALHIPIVGVDMIVGYALSALDKQRVWAFTGVAAAVLNPSLNLLVIPHAESAWGNGAIGAAIVTMVTELFMMVVGLRLLRGAVFDRTSIGYFSRALGAGLVMAAAVALAPGLTFLPALLLGALVYAGASLALKTASLQDVRSLIGYLRDRGAARGVPA